MKYSGIVTIVPGKRGGKPCIRGLQITVYDVLENLAYDEPGNFTGISIPERGRHSSMSCVCS
jgi:Protein of unknown function (DUF433)